jgi:N-acetylglutamate synthase
LTPWLAVPDRLVRLPDGVPTQLETHVLVHDVDPGAPDPAVTLTPWPDTQWLRLYQRDVPVDVLTAVVDGEVVFGRVGSAAIGRAAVTNGWVGLSAVRVAADQRRRGYARMLCATLLDWGAQHGATRAYAQVLVDNPGALALYESMGFSRQHRVRYVDARMV